MVTWLILVVLLVLLIAGIPRWPYSRDWGWGPAGVILLVLVIAVVLWLLVLRTPVAPVG